MLMSIEIPLTNAQLPHNEWKSFSTFIMCRKLSWIHSTSSRILGITLLIVTVTIVVSSFKFSYFPKGKHNILPYYRFLTGNAKPFIDSLAKIKDPFLLGFFIQRQ